MSGGARDKPVDDRRRPSRGAVGRGENPTPPTQASGRGAGGGRAHPSPGAAASPGERTGFDPVAEFRRLWKMPLAKLREEYLAAVGEPPPDDRAHLAMVRGIIFVMQRDETLRGREEAEKAREVKAEQEASRGVARGTHCILSCDRCRAEVIVRNSVKYRLRREAEAGERRRFLCAECREQDGRRAHERAGLERTRKAIETERELRVRRGRT